MANSRPSHVIPISHIDGEGAFVVGMPFIKRSPVLENMLCPFNVKIAKGGGVGNWLFSQQRPLRFNTSLFWSDIKTKIKSGILHAGLLRLRQRMLPQQVAVIYYHSVSTDGEGQSNAISSGITTKAERFEENMQIFRKEYNPITLNDVADWLQNGKILPPRSVAVTFDDGFADNYHIAAPIMEKYNIRGTIYLAVDAVQRQELPWYCRLNYLFHNGKYVIPNDAKTEREYARQLAVLSADEQRQFLEEIENRFGYRLDLESAPKMMTFEQARELRKRGHFIGNHTFSHGIAGLLSPELLHREIAGANEILERELGEPIEHFSYPHPYRIDPQWSEASQNETEKLGYKTIVLTRFGTVTPSDSPFLLPRISIGNCNADQFRWKLETALAGIKT